MVELAEMVDECVFLCVITFVCGFVVLVRRVDGIQSYITQDTKFL